MNLKRFEKGSINHKIVTALVELMNRGRIQQIAPLINCKTPVLSMALTDLVKQGHLTFNQYSGLYQLTPEALEVHDIKPAGIEVLKETGMQESTGKPGKRCTFCEKTKDPTEFYVGQQRCKVCFNGLAKVGKLRREAKPIPPELEKFVQGAPVSRQPAGPRKAPAPAAAASAKVTAEAEVVTIAPRGTARAWLCGTGDAAVAKVEQDGALHSYSLEQLQQLRDWASMVLKREMSA